MINLAEYITSRYPNAITRPLAKNGSWQSIRAVWRGDRNASCGLKWYGDRWRFSDFTTGQHGDIVDFLMQIEGYDKAEALRIAGGIDRQKVSPGKLSPKPAEQEQVEKLQPVGHRARAFANESVRQLREDGIPAVWGKRGFNMADCRRYKLGRDGDDGVLPILRGKSLVNVKIRVANTQRGKYRYAEPGHGSPAWHSPDLEEANAIILVEGEANAMAIHSVMAGQGFGAIGMAGASQPVGKSDLEGINGKPVYILADDDEAGRQAALRWCSQVPSAVGVMRPFGKQDACDIQGNYGKAVLKNQVGIRIAELDSSRKSGRDGAVRSWLSSSESVRDRSLNVAKGPAAARLTAVPAHTANGMYSLCAGFPEIGRYAIRLGKNIAFVVYNCLKAGAVTAQSLAQFAGLSSGWCSEILNNLVDAGLLEVASHGRTKVYSLVGNWKQVLNNMLGQVKARFQHRLERYIAQFSIDRLKFWDWVETTRPGQRWLEAHSGA